MANEVTVRVTAKDDTKAGFDSAKKNASGFGAELSKIGTIATGVFAGIAASAAASQIGGFISGSISAASNLQQAVGGVNAVFKDNAQTVLDWGKTNAASFGLSQRAFNELAAPLGAMLKNSGASMGEVTGRTIELTKRASDMAATFGGPVEEAMTAISAALRGEFDPIERFGVSIRAADLEAKALSMGLVDVSVNTLEVRDAQIDAEKAQRALTEAQKEHGKKSLEAREAAVDLQKAQEKLSEAMAGSAGEVSAAAKQQAAYALIMEQTADAAGQSAREADSEAGAAARLRAERENAQAQLGEKLLPLQLKWIELQSKGVEVLSGEVIPALETFVKYLRFATDEGDAQNDMLTHLPESLQKYAEATGETAVYIKQHWEEISSAVKFGGKVVEMTLDNVNRKTAEAARMIGNIASVADAIYHGEWPDIWIGIKNIAVQTIDGMIADINGRMYGLPGEMYDAGSDTVGGFIKGLIDRAREIPGVIKENITDVIPRGVKDLLGISSPSKVMIPLGEAVSQGIAKGITDGVSKYIEPALDLVGDFVHSQAYDATRAGIGGFVHSQPYNPARASGNGRGSSSASPSASKLSSPPPRQGLSPVTVQNPTVQRPTVMSHARGTITNGPEFALIGDNPSGKEAVIPSEMWGKLGGGTTFNLNVYGTLISERDLLQKLRDLLSGGALPEFSFQ